MKRMMVLIKDEVVQQKASCVDIAYVTEQGDRAVNEDTVAVGHNDENIVLAIADGLGAHGGGDIASKIAGDMVMNEYLSLKRPSSRKIHRIFGEIDSAIVAEQTEDIQMKTTLACVLLRNKRLYTAHLGDTRIYVFENERNVFITGDHSVAYTEMKENHGTLDEIRVNPARHLLKAALGVGRNVMPDISVRRAKPGMSVLICSDGFWEYVREDEMEKALTDTETSKEWLDAMLKCYSANAGEYNDNYSAVCLRISKNRGGEINAD